MYIVEVCIDFNRQRVSLTFFDDVGSYVRREYVENVKLIELNGKVRVSLNTLSTNTLCLVAEVKTPEIEARGNILRVGNG